MVRILIVFPISGLWSMSVLFANHGQVRVLSRGQGIIHKVGTIVIVIDVMGALVTLSEPAG